MSKNTFTVHDTMTVQSNQHLNIYFLTLITKLEEFQFVLSKTSNKLSGIVTKEKDYTLRNKYKGKLLSHVQKQPKKNK